jgi:hypothetical protein
MKLHQAFGHGGAAKMVLKAPIIGKSGDLGGRWDFRNEISIYKFFLDTES